MRRLSLAVAIAALLIAPSPAPADSVFGIRGLGILGRPLSVRTFSTGGAFALFDGTSSLNPAAFGQLGGPSGWASMAATSRRFTDGSLSASLSSTRFPLFGFATAAGRRAIIGVTVGEYLDRTWSITTSHDTLLRDTAVTFTDHATSSGGVSDVQLAGAYRLTGDITVGVGLHALVGSTRLSITRSFSLAGFNDYTEVATTQYGGVGVSAGVTARVNSKLAAAGTIRLNGHLKATADTSSATVSMPVELGGGVLFAPVPTVGLAATVGYQSWSRASTDLEAAGQPASRNVWSAAAGAELTMLRMGGRLVPLRFGYRWRQLPFPLPTAAGSTPISESAFSAGLGAGLAGGRASLDAGIEFGSRSAGSVRERFTTGFVGLTVRP